jgi:DHA3 family macrolide efflux protein-like MFS transporter
MRIAQVRPTGMLGFSIVWLGQFISLTGSGMTVFALTLWTWQAAGSAIALALRDTNLCLLEGE